MRRMLTLLAIGGLAWWGYGHWFGDEASAGGRVAEESEEFEDAALRAGAADESGGQRAADDRVSRFIASLQAGDERSRDHAFAVYRKLGNADDRSRLGRVLDGFVDEAPDAEAAVARLGTQNAFLHTELGRRAMDRVVERLGQESPATALPLSTSLLEAAMHGPLEQSDTEAEEALERAYAQHRNLVRRTVFDPGNAARARRYEVRSGDSLDRIAARFRESGLRVSRGLLATVNRIDNPNALQIGQKLRVPIDPVRCVLHKASFVLATYIGPDLVRIDRVAHGKEGHETPETTFVVGSTIANPDWHHNGKRIPFGSPDNPLGRYFVKFQHESYTGFGAHGTNEPGSIGTMASLGCLRLRPDDIRHFAEFVPQGTEVQVVP